MQAENGVHKFRTAIYQKFKFHKFKINSNFAYLKEVALTHNVDTTSDLSVPLSEIYIAVTPISFIQTHDINLLVTKILEYVTEKLWFFQVSIMYFRSDL
jgi:hypothetical protein